MAVPTIVVGYDASPGADVALERALDLARCPGDRLVIGCGVAPPGGPGEEVREHHRALREQAEQLTAAALARAREAGVDGSILHLAGRPVLVVPAG
jgi:nucleotide-binding universal stress UspA family protein